MQSQQHPHKCTHCGDMFQCVAPQSENYDGWPEVICLAYHEEGLDWCDNCLGQMLVDQAHDEWWDAIGSDILDAQDAEARDAN